MSATTLMRSRRFAPMFWTQFLSALSDNFVKNALVMLIVFRVGLSASHGSLKRPFGIILLALYIAITLLSFGKGRL